MKHVDKKLLAIGAVIIIAAIVVAVLLLGRDFPDGGQSINRSDNSEALIDNAIKQKDPALCEKVTKTTRPGPTDATVMVLGQDAVDWCKEQAEVGQRIYGG